MILNIKNFKVNIKGTLTDVERNVLSCGDPILYAADKGWLIFGWYLGDSVSGKTSYMYTREGSIRQMYFLPVKHHWQLPIFNHERQQLAFDEAKEFILDLQRKSQST